MSLAAVPNYLGVDLSSALPGMRFGMYLASKEGSGWAKTKSRPLDGARRLKLNRANDALTAVKSGKSALALKPKGEELLDTLPGEIRNKVLANQYVTVTTYVHEHTLVRIEP